LLVVPVRPSEAEIREQTVASSAGSSSTLGTSRHGVVAPMFRRSGAAPVHAQAPFTAPEIDVDTTPARTSALVVLESPARSPDSPIVLAHFARGPPCT
jgi:hypothetical protein